MTDAPKLFALTRSADEPSQIVGYGMVLPDGSAYSVSWPARMGAALFCASSAEQTAELRSAELVWLEDQP